MCCSAGLVGLPGQLVDNTPLFKSAEGEAPLVLLPGRPPSRLPLDQPLVATGAVKPGQKQVGCSKCGRAALILCC